MLTKDLLRFSNRQGRIMPRLLDATNKTLLDLAESLIAIYTENVGHEADEAHPVEQKGASFEELQEQVHPLITGYRFPLIAKGLNKLLLNRSTFQEADASTAALREELFAAASEILKAPGDFDLSQYRQRVAHAMGEEDADALSTRLYADLPIRQPLIALKAISPERLLHRYNMAQVQGLLLRCDGITVLFEEQDVGRLRQFFRHMKFFRLLAKVHPLEGDRYRLEINGPLSLFGKTQQYAKQLASFFPAICALNRWSIEATVKMPNHRAAQLQLDQESGLVSHFSRTTAYRPEYLDAFIHELSEKAPDWRLQEECHILNLGDGDLTVPDFTWKHKRGKTVHLELFHRWHATPVVRRLKGLDGQGSSGGIKGRKPNLIIGVARPLAKNEESAATLERSPWFESYGFYFNDIPPISRVAASLEAMRTKGSRGGSAPLKKGKKGSPSGTKRSGRGGAALIKSRAQNR